MVTSLKSLWSHVDCCKFFTHLRSMSPFGDGWRYGRSRGSSVSIVSDYGLDDRAIKNYGVGVAFNGITSLLNFMKSELKFRQNRDFISLTFRFLREVRLKMSITGYCSGRPLNESHSLRILIGISTIPCARGPHTTLMCFVRIMYIFVRFEGCHSCEFEDDIVSYKLNDVSEVLTAAIIRATDRAPLKRRSTTRLHDTISLKAVTLTRLF
jgi:hypothetical protein